MTKNEKLNNLKDLSHFYEEEIDRLNNENNDINTNHTNQRNEIIINVVRSEKRFTRSLYRFGASILIGLFTIGLLSASPVSIVLSSCLFCCGLGDFIVNMVGLNKSNKQAESLEQLDSEKTAKIDSNNKLIQEYEKKNQKASKIINTLSQELYHPQKTLTKNVDIAPTTTMKNNEIIK